MELRGSLMLLLILVRNSRLYIIVLHSEILVVLEGKNTNWDHIKDDVLEYENELRFHRELTLFEVDIKEIWPFFPPNQNERDRAEA